MKAWMKVAVLVVAGWGGTLSPARAQTPEPSRGSEIKVVLDDGREFRGGFRSWTEEGLLLNGPGSRREVGWRTTRDRVLRKEHVTGVWLKTGEQAATERRLGQAVKVTALGALIGAGVGYTSWDDSDWLFRREEYAVMHAIVFATPIAIGGVLWAVLGKDDVWTRITPAWEPSGEKSSADWTQDLLWSTGVTPEGQLALGLTLRR